MKSVRLNVTSAHSDICDENSTPPHPPGSLASVVSKADIKSPFWMDREKHNHPSSLYDTNNQRPYSIFYLLYYGGCCFSVPVNCKKYIHLKNQVIDGFLCCWYFTTSSLNSCCACSGYHYICTFGHPLPSYSLPWKRRDPSIVYIKMAGEALWRLQLKGYAKHNETWI